MMKLPTKPKFKKAFEKAYFNYKHKYPVCGVFIYRLEISGWWFFDLNNEEYFYDYELYDKNKKISKMYKSEGHLVNAIYKHFRND